MREVLKLNADYNPIGVISWKRAVTLWWDGKVEIVEEYDDFDLKSVSFTIKCPSVVRLLEFVGYRKRVKYNRRNIYHRDNFTCQYCNKKPGIKELNLDHVIPRDQGGMATWKNIVTACISCNGKKRNRTPAQANMTLKTDPFVPTYDQYIKYIIDFPKSPDAWRSYLYWHQELENDNETS